MFGPASSEIDFSLLGFSVFRFKESLFCSVEIMYLCGFFVFFILYYMFIVFELSVSLCSHCIYLALLLLFFASQITFGVSICFSFTFVR
ncbi:hypothetical protein ERO13_D03G000101v2 [Gossypium hirsutum]|uniref:Uncharacterized protein n=1 Tax=Gossypium tomentosum TaxID=34277 RepID=A0A5D2LHA6_GOSTO|nr:hypothetical protein ERO13_D03G000101v2 [Gossypium hirsutum]TYH78595.1 hypothetical protein ES332_D03G000100v1 [Gossypium tomentosum]